MLMPARPPRSSSGDDDAIFVHVCVYIGEAIWFFSLSFHFQTALLLSWELMGSQVFLLLLSHSERDRQTLSQPVTAWLPDWMAGCLISSVYVFRTERKAFITLRFSSKMRIVFLSKVFFLQFLFFFFIFFSAKIHSAQNDLRAKVSLTQMRGKWVRQDSPAAGLTSEQLIRRQRGWTERKKISWKKLFFFSSSSCSYYSQLLGGRGRSSLF